MKRLALACAAALGLTAAPASALPVPVDPSNAEVSGVWANPAIRAGEGTKGELFLIDAPLAAPKSPFHVKLRVANHSDEPLEKLTVIPRRGPATGSVWDQRVATVAGVGEYGMAGVRRELSVTVKPGEHVDVDIEITPEEMGFPGTGAYPVLFQLVDSDGSTLDTERFHLRAWGGMPEGARPAGLTALYPVTAPVDILPGETGDAPKDAPLVLSSESLAEQLAPGGRLDQLVSQYREAVMDPEVGLATCMSLDPALVDTVDRMSRGYTVATERAPVVEEPKRLRDSWGSGEAASLGEPGTGAADAAAWIAKLRTLAATECTVAMPWANTDLNAVVRTGDPWLVREAVERGPFTLQRVLGTTGTLNTVVPASGYVTEEAAPALGWADHSRSTIPTEGLSGAWERAVASAGASGDGGNAGGAGGDSDSALEDRALAAPAWAAAPAPAQPVRVLVPAATVVSEQGAVPGGVQGGVQGGAPDPNADRFAWIAPGVMAVRYQDSLASTLATVSPDPHTVGYSNEALRFNYAADSAAARRVNAAAAVQLAVQNAWSFETAPGQWAATAPVLVQPPGDWDADAAAALLGTVAELLRAGAAAPVTFGDYLSPPMDAAVPPAASVGTPFEDPTAYTDSELLAATQQSAFINDLSTLLAPDPSIALTRYGFTLPLRRDILAAFGEPGRQSMGSYMDAAAATSARLSGSRAMLGELRGAVSLIPPGNVYTRTSPSSPLLIVAQNGMPLPVDTAIRYDAPAGVRLNVPDTLRVPARGSVTVQMTADLPQDARNTNLQLYLAGPQSRAISQPVDIAVRTPSMALRGWALLAVAAVVVALLLLYSIGKRRRRRGPPDKGTSIRKMPLDPGETISDTA